MDEKIYTITLDDGTQIENLRLNGNNFISQEQINPEIFDGNLGQVIINDSEKDEFHENMEFVQIVQMGDEYWFVLRDVSKYEIESAKLRSDLDYLAMMAYVEI